MPHYAVRASFSVGRWSARVCLSARFSVIWPASWVACSDKSRSSESVEVRRIWEVYDGSLSLVVLLFWLVMFLLLGVFIPVHRQSGGYFSCFTETGLTVQNCAKDRRFARCISWIGWDTPVVVQRQVLGLGQCRKTVEVPQLQSVQFLERLLTRPLLATTGAFWFRQSASGGAAVAVFSTGADGVRQCRKLFEGSTVQNTIEIPQFFSRFIFSAGAFFVPGHDENDDNNMSDETKCETNQLQHQQQVEQHAQQAPHQARHQ